MPITYKDLPPTDYDKVIVFDLLSEIERKKYNISEKLKEVFEIKGMPIVVIKYLTAQDDFKNQLKTLLGDCKAGKKFIFHFVAHGNENCIGFKHSGEQIEWEILGKELSEINKASNESLVLNMTSCLGLHGIKSVNFSSNQNPFFGLIGYTENLPIPKGIKANEIFYNHVIDGKPINTALTLLQKEMKDDKFLCITSQGYCELKRKK